MSLVSESPVYLVYNTSIGSHIGYSANTIWKRTKINQNNNHVSKKWST